MQKTRHAITALTPPFYLFKSISELLKMLGNGSTFLELSTSTLKLLQLPFPKINMQQRIAEVLARKCAQIDAALATIAKSIEKLRQYRQSVISRAVTKGLDQAAPMKDSGVEWIGEIPEGWEVKRLKEISNLNPSIIPNLAPDQEVSYFPMESIKNGYATPLKVQYKEMENCSYNILSNGDIMLAKVTPCFENGNLAIADQLINNYGFATTEVYIIRSYKCNIKFLFYYLQSLIFVERAISTMYGTGGLKRISSRFMQDEKLAMPDCKEQEEIAQYLDRKCAQIDSLIAGKEKLREKLEAYKKSLIYEYVTGKREAPDGRAK